MTNEEMDEVTDDVFLDGNVDETSVYPEGAGDAIQEFLRSVSAPAKVKKGYGVGKNPNSHKKTGGGRSPVSRAESEKRYDKDPKVRAYTEAKLRIRTARLALNRGDKQTASNWVHSARMAVRSGRDGGTSSLSRHMDGLREPWTLKKSEPGPMDVHTSAPMGEPKRKKRKVKKNSRFDLTVPISKVDKKEQIVYGWASPVREFGIDVIDKQGDVIDLTEVRKAAHDFMLNSRVGGQMHKDIDISKVTIVESIVLTQDLQKALGVDIPFEGWFIGAKIHDADAWAKVEDGTYTGFSIGGSGVREAMTKAYAPGKNPNSHKRGSSNRGFKGEKAGDANVRRKGVLEQTKKQLRLARIARTKGDQGKSSYHAQQARSLLRFARHGESAEGVYPKGLKQTDGAKFHEESRLWNKSRKMSMDDARSAPKGSKYRSDSVKAARYENGMSRHWAAKARVTKGYAVGKNPNSHKTKLGHTSARDKKVIARQKEVGRKDTYTDYRGKKGNKAAEFSGSARAALMTARDALHAAKKAKAEGNKGATSHYALQARRYTRLARLSSPHDLKETPGAELFNRARTLQMGGSWGTQRLHEKARVTKGYAVGKNPNSHKKKGSGAGKPTSGMGHLKSALKQSLKDGHIENSVEHLNSYGKTLGLGAGSMKNIIETQIRRSRADVAVEGATGAKFGGKNDAVKNRLRMVVGSMRRAVQRRVEASNESGGPRGGGGGLERTRTGSVYGDMLPNRKPKAAPFGPSVRLARSNMKVAAARGDKKAATKHYQNAKALIAAERAKRSK